MSLPLGTGERVFAHFILDIWGPERPTRGWKRGPSLPGWDLRLGLRTRPPKFQLTLPRVTVTPARTTLCPRGSGGQDVCLMSRVSRGLEQRLVHGLGSSSAPERRIRNDTSAWSEALGAWRTQDLPERSPLAERGRGSLAPTSQTRKPRLRHGRPFARRRTAGQSLEWLPLSQPGSGQGRRRGAVLGPSRALTHEQRRGILHSGPQPKIP
ncbi:uncharacterized protein LOC123578990 isoform X2 [Leopardus geoffroyi]|uniref:uncharacterized protein LOC123578990 isoform X2 n=1 Tax=Leopardus geoffroyi TaxID=46844 RepID=UPI001E262DCB|nr:uncharacterized protein LOC123578990 isoform X2 [Leopardus geoffroyi]